MHTGLTQLPCNMQLRIVVAPSVSHSHYHRPSKSDSLRGRQPSNRSLILSFALRRSILSCALFGTTVSFSWSELKDEKANASARSLSLSLSLLAFVLSSISQLSHRNQSEESERERERERGEVAYRSSHQTVPATAKCSPDLQLTQSKRTLLFYPSFKRPRTRRRRGQSCQPNESVLRSNSDPFMWRPLPDTNSPWTRPSPSVSPVAQWLPAASAARSRRS